MDKVKAFEILGLDEKASEEEIKNAYRELAKKYSPQNYEAGPLREDAENKMNEINDAFDKAISVVRGHDMAENSSAQQNNTPFTAPSDEPYTPNVENEPNTPPPVFGNTPTNKRYPQIRRLINEGKLEEAISELSSVLGGANDAEWNFLMGSVYYYKGWLEQALHYFKTAVKLEPGNREYEAALHNLENSADGHMVGNPYANTSQGAATMNCICRTCTLMCCMDMCCGMCRGF